MMVWNKQSNLLQKCILLLVMQGFLILPVWSKPLPLSASNSLSGRAKGVDFHIDPATPALSSNPINVEQTTIVTFSIHLAIPDGKGDGGEIPATHITNQRYTITASTPADGLINGITNMPTGFNADIGTSANSETIENDGGNSSTDVLVSITMGFSTYGTKNIIFTGTVSFDDGSSITLSAPHNEHHWGSTTASVLQIGFSQVMAASGFDFGTPSQAISPPWLVVPLNGTNTAYANINPADVLTKVVFQSPLVATTTVTPTIPTSQQQLLTVNGIVFGAAEVDANDVNKASNTFAKLRIVVKKPEKLIVSFHFVSDTNPLHKTTHTPSEIPGMISAMNSIWGQQANVIFKSGKVDNLSATSDLGDYIATGNLNPVRNLGTDTDAQINVYFVWALEDSNGVSYYGYTNSIPGQYFLIANVSGNLGRTSAHEAGHVLGLVHNFSWVNNLMYTPDQGDTAIVIHKAEVDIANKD